MRRSAAEQHLPSGVPGMAPRVGSHAAAEAAAGDLLVALGADLSDEGLRETPRRIAKAYAELLTPTPSTRPRFPTTRATTNSWSCAGSPSSRCACTICCRSRAAPHVAYLPGDRIIGLSKLGRVVDLFAHDLQVQERLTTQVADWLVAELAPRGVGVVVEAEHLCMSLRGVQKAGSRTVTSALRGLVKDDPRTRQEFLSLIAS